MKDRGPGRRAPRRDPDGDPFRPMDERRAREIRRWLEGERTDAPTEDELREFLSWVADRIERDLARHTPVADLLDLMNAARDVLREGSPPDGGADAGEPGDGAPPPDDRTDGEWMGEALREARLAADEGEVPVGAVVVRGGRILGRGRNQRERLNDPTAHAEMIALTQAAAAAGTWRLDGCTMVVTLEPCPMCAGALVNARMGRLVYGAADPKAGACGTLFDLVNDPRLNHRMPVTSGVLEGPCGEVLREFFRARRRGIGNA